MIPLTHVAIELTPPAEESLFGKRLKLGMALVPSARDFGAIRTDQFSLAKALADDSPHAVAAVLDSTNMAALLVDSEHRAQQIRPFTRRPVVSRLADLANVTGVLLPNRLNLIYHICPLKTNDGWKDNLYQLLPRWGIFSGRKVFAVAVGPGLHSLQTVQSLVNRPDAQWIIVPNDRELREVASFLPLLQSIQSTDPNEATFYAHTKGNSTADNAAGAWAWTLAMYRHLLDQIEVVRDALRQYAAVGACKMVWPQGTRSPYPTCLPLGNWMFAGTFFWLRHDRIFRAAWRNVCQDRYGAEAWLSTLIPESEALSVYQPWPVNQYPSPSPYQPHVHWGRL